MFSALSLSVVLLSAAPSAAELKAYETAASTVGRDAEANIKLALWCEEHGLEAERIRHLSMAVVADPSNSKARGLLGLVRDEDRWRRPEAIADRIRSDAELSDALAEYNTLRAKTPDSADAHEKLARWCEQNGLMPERTAHLNAVVRLDPSRESAWKKLGYRRHKGRWMTQEQISDATAEAVAQHKADLTWRTRLQDWKENLKSDSKAADAERGLATVHDPRAVPSVWGVFVSGSAPDRARGIQLLGQIDGPAASRGLAMLAVFAPEAESRRAAGETLLHRDPRESVGLLIAVLEAPMKYEVKPSGGPGDPGELFVEGEKYNVRRHYEPPPLPQQTLDLIGQRLNGVFIGGEGAGGDVVNPAYAAAISNTIFNQNALAPGVVGFLRNAATNPGSVGQIAPNQRTTTAAPLPGFGAQWLWNAQARRDLVIQRNLEEARRAVLSANLVLENDIRQVENTNREIKARNDAVLQTLEPLTGKNFGADPERWNAWWTDQQGYAYRSQSAAPKPTFDQVAATYRPSYTPPPSAHSCFAAGTTVQTLRGPRKIETLQIGDRVLSQNAITGALAYKPVLRAIHNPPAPTLSIGLGSDAVVATGIHRFWKAGKGWIMARDLKPGDIVRTVDGSSRVESVTDAPTQPVFNLEIADGHSFFVGKAGALVHDNSLVLPVTDPFDASADLVAANRP